jgi:hypothetical protein
VGFCPTEGEDEEEEEDDDDDDGGGGGRGVGRNGADGEEAVG